MSYEQNSGPKLFEQSIWPNEIVDNMSFCRGIECAKDVVEDD